MPSLPVPASRCLVLAGALLLGGCGPDPNAPLPPETDLHAYSLAVAERARALVPSAGAKGLFHVGRVHERFGFEDTALEIYRDVTEEDPDLEGPWLRTGYILSQRKDRMEEAANAYQQVLLKDPRAPGVYTRIGLVFSHQGRLDDAVRMFEEEIRLGTATEETYYNLGQAFSLQGRHEDAVEAYQEASRMAPGMRSAFYSLAQSLRALGRLDEEKMALEAFRKLKEEEDRAAAGKGAAKDDLAARRRDAAETWMDAAEVISNAISTAKEAAGKEALAPEFRRAIEEAIRFDPTLVEARQVLLGYWKQRKDMGKAVQACEEALKAIPGDPTLARECHELAGQCIQAAKGAQSPAGWVDLAERLLRATVASAPSFPDGHRELARLLLFWRDDRPDLVPRAVEEARAAVDLHPSPENYDILAFAYHRSGRPELAFRTLEEGVQRHPEDPTLRQRMERLKGAGSEE